MKNILLSCFSLMIALLTLVNCNFLEKQKDDQPRRIEILFLGHSNEHHNSRKYMPILASALAPSGINFTYTEKVEDLNPDILALYDGILIYANHENRAPEQEQALLDFVSEGNAFIPIHCASFCFKESPEYVNLVGGQFKSHGTDTFTATIVDKVHPITQGLEEFSTWDETYVHHKLADDITVLMERVEGNHREPWTWVKKYGKGKVFYTAYGHDERTWNNPGFLDLIKNGIVWAVNDPVKKNWEAFVKDMPTLAYKKMDNIPNYENRDPAPKYQMPLTPEESQKLIQVSPGFKLELFASEPNIINPIAMNWDEKGRLWVVETVDYPNTVRDDKGSGDDRIKICEDTNGDGKADKFTIFAENLNIPTSFTFVNGGILVSQAPNFLFLKDTDGDDKADVKEIIMEGWGVFDTHAGPSNLQYGIDNKIYGAVGYSGFKGSISGVAHEFGQGIYRFDKNFGAFEFLTRTSNNTWGLGITESNSIFASTANNTHSVFMGIPNKNLKDVEGISLKGSQKIDGHYAMLPITQNIRQVDVFGGFTAAAGHHFYTARSFPRQYWNKTAFVCEPTGGVVHTAMIEKDGAGYKEWDGGNLMASSDEWVSPVEAKVGPDGAVWVLDWYNFIVQHNPTPTVARGGYDAVNGPGNAYINPLRDKERGRVWRISPKDSKKITTLKLDKKDSPGLVKALTNDNMFWRLTAQRLLVENGDMRVLPSLYKLIEDRGVDALGLNPGALHALWTLEGLGAIAPDSEALKVVKSALTHPSAAVKKAVIQILPRNEKTDEFLLESNVLTDTDPKVQLAALLYFSESRPSLELGEKLYQLSQDKQVVADNWLATALYATSSKHYEGFTKAFMAANPKFEYTQSDADEGQLQNRNHSQRSSGSFDNIPLDELLVKTYFGYTMHKKVNSEIDYAQAATIIIKTIVNEMKYDVTEFVVEAGKPVELVFENTDFMQHNLVIAKRGEKEKVGMAADKLAMDPKGADLEYVPEMPEVLYATAIVDPDKKVVLRFVAPDEPGDYPYICTFPGHWRIMQGNMKVVIPK